MKGWRRLIHFTRSNDEMTWDGMNLTGVRNGERSFTRYNGFCGSDAFGAESSMILELCLVLSLPLNLLGDG
jgi:hypothetical protein